MFYYVNIEFQQEPCGKDTILVFADSEIEAIEKITKFYASFGTTQLEILSVKNTSICCLLGNPKASGLYIGTLVFVGSNMERDKRRNIAIQANGMKEAISYVEKALEDVSSIKHKLLTERQLRTIEYYEEMSHIDYGLARLVSYEKFFLI